MNELDREYYAIVGTYRQWPSWEPSRAEKALKTSQPKDSPNEKGPQETAPRAPEKSGG